jgi:ABC-type methionine transport system permease subunit
VTLGAMIGCILSFGVYKDQDTNALILMCTLAGLVIGIVLSIIVTVIEGRPFWDNQSAMSVADYYENYPRIFHYPWIIYIANLIRSSADDSK